MQSDPNQTRKRSEAAKTAARTRAAQKHARDQSDHFACLTEACVEGGFRDAQETEVVSLWAHDEITRLRSEVNELEIQLQETRDELHAAREGS